MKTYIMAFPNGLDFVLNLSILVSIGKCIFYSFLRKKGLPKEEISLFILNPSLLQNTDRYSIFVTTNSFYIIIEHNPATDCLIN